MSTLDSAARPPGPGRSEHAGRTRCDPTKALVTGGAEHRQNTHNSEGADVSSGIMIDRAEARDRDDAIWVVPAGDGWDAVVHIADVVDRVTPGGEADQRAGRQLRTIYLPDSKSVPMLPRGVQHAAALGRRLWGRCVGIRERRCDAKCWRAPGRCCW